MRVRPAWTAGLTAGVLCLLLPASAGAQPPEPPPAYLLDYSSVPMTRNAALVETTVRVVERGTNWALDTFAGDLIVRKSTGGFFARAGRSLFDFFLEGYGSAIVHEYGHATRAEESGRSATVSIRPFKGSFFSMRGPPRTGTEQMSVFGGGFEGETVLIERVEDRIHARGTATQGDLTLLLTTAVRSELYVLNTLSEHRLASPERLFITRNVGPGDPVQYALGLTAARLSQPVFNLQTVTPFFDEVQSNARSIRRRSFLNLLDYEHATTTLGLFRDYMWRGQREVGVRWLTLGSVSLIPAMGFRLSPVGPELQVKTRYKLPVGVGRAHVRWSEPATPGTSRLVGAGGEFHRVRRGRVAPTLALDIWRNPDGTKSLRGEAGAIFSRSPGDRFVLSAGLGTKGRGYLLGHPIAPGTYFNLGAGLRF